jgi:hypothetical protein
MINQLITGVGVLAVGLFGVLTLGALVDIFRDGERRVRNLREEGGGVAEKARGELRGGQRRPSSGRSNGLHMRVTPRGGLSFREKSVIAK